MEINTIGRPRNVGWVRAAALLYGDWGTSKAYFIVLGEATIGFAAFPHLLAVCLLTGLVGINYILVCKHFPNGGGLYTAAGLISRRLASIGGLQLDPQSTPDKPSVLIAARRICPNPCGSSWWVEFRGCSCL